jgi:hypothetical protein
MDIANAIIFLGAFFAKQKTGLSGGSAAGAAASRPCNPWRTQGLLFGTFSRKKFYTEKVVTPEICGTGITPTATSGAISPAYAGSTLSRKCAEGA